MASTGLLAGVNPYRSGNVAVDYSSKPLQYAVQEIQHQKAQSDAVDKYYKDYEKSLNTAGLSPEEQKIFLDKLQQVKSFAMKNHEQIGNPSRYGYDAQSTLDAGFRQLSNYIGEAKQAAGERKAFKTIHDSRISQGKDVSDNYLDVWNNALKPVGGGYVAPDMSQIQYFDRHNPTKYENDVWNKIDLPKKETYIPETDENGKVVLNAKGLPTGKVMKQTSTYITPEVAKIAGNNAVDKYNTSLGDQKFLNTLYTDPEIKKASNEEFKKYYGKDINSVEDFVRGHAILLKKTGVVNTGPAEERLSWSQKNEITNQQANQRTDRRIAAQSNAANAAIESVINSANTGKPFADNLQVTEYAFGPNISKVYIRKEDIPEDKNQFEIQKAGGKAKMKSENINPVFGRDANNEIIIAYPKIQYKGQTDAPIDWANAKPYTNDIKSTILDKEVPSAYKANVLAPKPGKGNKSNTPPPFKMK